MTCSLADKPKYPNIADMLRDFSDSASTGQGTESLSVYEQSTDQTRSVRETISLSPTPEPIQRLRDLEEGWDGRDAEPPSEQLLAYAEAFWLTIEKLPPVFQRPTVRMTRDGYIAFSWMQPKQLKELHVWFHDGEEVDFEIHLRTSRERVDKKEATSEDIVNAMVKFFGS
jgi:hypothetical protein